MKKTIISLLILILCLGYIINREFLNDKTKPDLKEEQKLSHYIDIDDIDKISIIQNTDTIVISKKDDNWIMESYHNFPVKTDSVDKLISSLKKVNFSKIISKNVNNHKLYQVDEKGIKLSLFNGKDVFFFIIGKPGPSYATCYVRLPDKDNVYKLDFNLKFNLSPSQNYWIKSKLFDISNNDVIDFKITTANKKQFYCTRKSFADTWVVDTNFDTYVNSNDKINHIVDGIIGYTTSEAVSLDDKEIVLNDKNDTVINVTTSDKKYTLKLIGRKKDKYIGRFNDINVNFVYSDYGINKILNSITP